MSNHFRCTGARGQTPSGSILSDKITAPPSGRAPRHSTYCHHEKRCHCLSALGQAVPNVAMAWKSVLTADNCCGKLVLPCTVIGTASPRTPKQWHFPLAIRYEKRCHCLSALGQAVPNVAMAWKSVLTADNCCGKLVLPCTVIGTASPRTPKQWHFPLAIRYEKRCHCLSALGQAVPNVGVAWKSVLTADNSLVIARSKSPSPSPSPSPRSTGARGQTPAGSILSDKFTAPPSGYGISGRCSAGAPSVPPPNGSAR